MPHHPGGGGVVKEAAFWTEITMEDVLFLVLEERAKGGVDNAFWWSGGAGGVKDVKRVRWWEISEGERCVWVWHTGYVNNRLLHVSRKTYQSVNSKYSNALAPSSKTVLKASTPLSAPLTVSKTTTARRPLPLRPSTMPFAFSPLL